MLSLHGLVLVGLLATSIDGGDVTHWLTTTYWSTAWQTPEQQSVTFWETKWSTAPPETIYNTVWSTYVQPTTYISVETTTETITQFVYSTLDNYFTNTATQTLNNYYTNTATETQISQETATATITSARVFVTTLYSTVTEACTPTTTSLTGLVLCPYRDVNPTYTPPAPLPTDYLWGCPPGTLCTPKQINCNFERDFPADTYFCDPNDCVVPPALPDISDAWINYNCTPFVPVEGYPNLSPIPFGLDYSIFEFNGQPGHSCPPPPPPPPPSTSTSTWTPPPPPPPSSTSTWADWSSEAPPAPASTWADWTSPAVPPPAPAPSSWKDWSSPVTPPASPPTSTWAAWTSPAALPSPATSWQGWGSQSYGDGHSWSGGGSRPSITARAEMAERDLVERGLYDIPSNCYGPCDKAGLEGANCQLVYSKLCPTASPFIRAYDNCGSCIKANKPTAINSPPVALISSLASFINYCNNNSPSTPAGLQSTSTPSSSLATTPATLSSTPSSPTTTSASTPSSPATTSASTPSSPTTTSASTTSSSPLVTSPTSTSSTSVVVITTSFTSSSSTGFTPSISTFTSRAVFNSNINLPIIALVVLLSLLLNFM